MKYINDFTFIDDSTLINNFYDILINEFEFDSLFMEMGIYPKINSKHDEIKIVKEWIKDNNDESNLEIELLNQLEIFRDISGDPKKIDEQIKSIIIIYELLLENFKKKCSIEYDLDFLDYEENLEYLKRSQDLTFSFKKFKRDNIIHQLRVFLLGCFIINHSQDFWIERIWGNMWEELEKMHNSHHFYVLKRAINFNIDMPGKVNDKFIIRSVFFTWLISSLFHDIGRSVEDANETIKTISDSFLRIPNFNWAHYKSYKGNKKLCKLCPSCLTLKLDEAGEEKKKALITFLEWLPNEKNDFVKNIIETGNNELDHGIISAVLATDSEFLDEFEKYDSDLQSSPFEYIFHLLVHYSLISISLHNLQRYFFISPLTLLLTAVDTLQEWERVTKIDDNKIKIYPCDHIEIKIDNFNINSSNCIKIEAIIPYEESEDVLLKEIFNRRVPDYKKLFEELKKSKSDYDKFKSFFIKGIELRIVFIESDKIIKLKICGHCGDILFEEDELKIKDGELKKHLSNLTCANVECEAHGKN